MTIKDTDPSDVKPDITEDVAIKEVVNNLELDVTRIPDMDKTADVVDEHVIDTITLPNTSSKVVLPRTEHTAKHTTMLQRVEPADEVVGDGTDLGHNTIDFFLGTQKSTIMELGELIEKWVDYMTDNRSFEMNKVEASVLQASKMNYEEYVKENYPSKTVEEIDLFCRRYFGFTQTLIEFHNVASSSNRNPDLTNMNQKATGEVIGDIRAIMPGVKNKDKFSVSDLMRRDSRRVNDEPDAFDVVLRNSFISLKIKRPDVLQLGRLVTDIASTVKGYVREVNGNSLTLSRAAGYKAIYKYLMNNTTFCSLKGTNDFMELAEDIMLSDFPTLLVSLTNAASYKGVDLRIHCLNNTCGWSAVKRVDLSKTIKFDNKQLSTDQAAVLGNLFNGIKKYSREDIAKVTKNSNYGVETKIYFNNNSQYVVIKPPTLAVYFGCFDFFLEMINPEIQNLRNNIIDNDDYQFAYQTLLGSIAGCEYIHWISELHIIPSNPEDDEIVYDRNENELEFNKGIAEILKENNELTKDLIRFVHNKAPLMTNTVVGISHYACPNCKQSSGKDIPNSRGVTPFDAYMHFFTHTHQMIQNQADSLLSVDTEALTNSTE